MVKRLAGNDPKYADGCNTKSALGTSKNPLNRIAKNPPLRLAGSAIRFKAVHAHPNPNLTQKCRALTRETIVFKLKLSIGK